MGEELGCISEEKKILKSLSKLSKYVFALGLITQPFIYQSLGINQVTFLEVKRYLIGLHIGFVVGNLDARLLVTNMM